MLVGLTTDDGWLVESMIKPAPGATGGHFSSSYRVTRGDEEAFLKAIDYVRALNAPDTAAELKALTDAFVFERNLCRACADGRMRNVVRIISDGELNVPDSGPLGRVSYLIFELARG